MATTFDQWGNPISGPGLDAQRARRAAYAARTGRSQQPDAAASSGRSTFASAGQGNQATSARSLEEVRQERKAKGDAYLRDQGAMTAGQRAAAERELQALRQEEFALSGQAVSITGIDPVTGQRTDGGADVDPGGYQRVNGRPYEPPPPLPPPAPIEDPALVARRAQAEALRVSMGWIPPALRDLYIQHWITYGDANLAWGMVRADPQYEIYFPKNRRTDGTVRLPEMEYIAYREGFEREFVQRGYNPAYFQDLFVAQVEGDVSISEFRAKLSAKINGVINNLPQVREEYAEFNGLTDLSDEALIAAGINPKLGLELLEGRIAAAQVAGEAAVQGFQRDRERAKLLSTAGGLTQATARQLYLAGARRVPQLSRMSQRFNDPLGTYDITRFEQSRVFGDVSEQRTEQRLLASEDALFAGAGGAQIAKDPLGQVGLRRR